MDHFLEKDLTALLWDLRVLELPADWVNRHSALLSRYVDISRLNTFLETQDGNMARASTLSGAELDVHGHSDGLHSLRSVFDRLHISVGGPASAGYYSCAPLTLTNIISPGPSSKTIAGTVLAALDQELERIMENPPESPSAFMILLDTLLKKHLWCVPAAPGKDVDISLYDKMKATAAIAACLERTQETQPFLLLAADFSGIQKYIFAVARTNSKGVSKRLRARSFLVDVMIQSLAYQVCEKFGVPYSSILMLTGGKFHLLLPNGPETLEKLSGMGKTLETELFTRFHGEISVNLAWVAFGAEGLTDYSATITELSRRLRREKAQPFHSVLTDETGWQEAPFVLAEDLAGKRSCPSCGRLIDSSREVCAECRLQEELGGKLAAADCLWFSRDGGEFRLWGNCWLSFTRSQAQGPLLRVEQLNCWDIPASRTHLPLAVRLMANQLPKGTDGEPLTFSDIAERSSGSKRLAVLKADVDTLGYLFADGMREKNRHYGTISRVSTLSRMLEMFFSGYISHLLKNEYTSVYSVFSGGDDLFLIGPWDVMPGMALRIQKDFSAFAGHNPCVTLSAAVYAASPKTNIALLAERSEEELKRVKNSAPQALYPGKEGRNGVSFFGDIFSWEDLEKQLDNLEKLRPAVGTVSVSILRRVARYSGMYRRFLESHDVLGLMFEPLLHYDQARNYSGNYPPFFLRYVQALPKNAADYRTVNRDLYFAQTVMACVLNQTKEERDHGI